MSPVPEGKRRMQDFYITEKSVQFKIYELFISGIFHLIFQTPVDYVTETAESKTTNKVWNYCILQLLHIINISLVKSLYQRKMLQKIKMPNMYFPYPTFNFYT